MKISSFLIIWFSTMLLMRETKANGSSDQLDQTGKPDPSFDPTIPNEVAVLAGETAYLPCIVNNFGNNVVAWLRKSDVHVLTVGVLTYTADPRFDTSFERRPTTFTLRVRKAQSRDSGLYECQVSSKKSKITRLVNLKVFDEPVFDESVPKEVSVVAGETAYLRCVIVPYLGTRTIIWNRGNETISIGMFTYANDSRYQVTPTQGLKEWTLSIKDTQLHDAGIFQCKVSTEPEKIYSIKLTVHDVVEDTNPHLEKSSAVNMTFVIPKNPELPASIVWYHNGQVIANSSASWGLLISNDSDTEAQGHFILENIHIPDAGNQICVPTTTNLTPNGKQNNSSPKIEILGAPDVHMYQGSTINLTCAISDSFQPPGDIFWYHNGQILSNDSAREGVQVYTEQGSVAKGFLLISSAQFTDEGNYSCASSTMNSTSIQVQIHEVPEAGIVGAPEMTIEEGSTLNLTCVIHHSPLNPLPPPQYIFWYHNEENLIIDPDREGIRIYREESIITKSFLLIENAQLTDSGKYVCMPSNAAYQSIDVKVRTE